MCIRDRLQAILDDDDISEENIKAIKAEQAKRSGAGEFSGSGKFEEREYAVRKGDRQGQNAYRGTLEYEDILDGLKHIKYYPKKIKRADGIYMDRFGNPNLSPVGSDSGQAVAQGTAGAQEAKADADTTIIVNQSNMGGGSGGGGATVPLPVTTKDNSSASQLAAVSN